MTRQTWQSIIGACLCAGLLPGCANLFPFTLFRKEKPVDSQTVLKEGQLVGKDPRQGGAGEGGKPTGCGQGGGLISDYGIIPNGPPDRLKLDGKFPLFPRGDFPNEQGDVAGYPQEEPEPRGKTNLPRPLGGVPKPGPQGKPPATEEPLVQALECFLKKRPELALAHLNRYDPATQELLLRFLPVLAEMKEGMEKLTPEEVAALREQVQGLLVVLLARSKLVIERMCYCVPELKSPGVFAYRALRPDHQFLPPCGPRPGEQVFLSIELRNLSGARRGDFYETRVSSWVKIVDSTGRDYGKRLDTGKVPLRRSTFASEFAHVYSFWVPEIPPGRYNLILEVRDETTPTPRLASSSLPFVVAADPAPAN
jgi:hypothetical protein